MSYKKNIIELLNKLMIINHIDNYDIYNELVSCINKLTDTNEIYIPINMLQINDQPQIEVVSNMIDEIGDTSVSGIKVLKAAMYSGWQSDGNLLCETNHVKSITPATHEEVLKYFPNEDKPTSIE